MVPSSEPYATHRHRAVYKLQGPLVTFLPCAFASLDCARSPDFVAVFQDGQTIPPMAPPPNNDHVEEELALLREELADLERGSAERRTVRQRMLTLLRHQRQDDEAGRKPEELDRGETQTEGRDSPSRAAYWEDHPEDDAAKLQEDEAREPGWYPDPLTDGTYKRWWDGKHWMDGTRPPGGPGIKRGVQRTPTRERTNSGKRRQRTRSGSSHRYAWLVLAALVLFLAFWIADTALEHPGGCIPGTQRETFRFGKPRGTTCSLAPASDGLVSWPF